MTSVVAQFTFGNSYRMLLQLLELTVQYLNLYAEDESGVSISQSER